MIEPENDKLITRGIEDPRDVLKWIREKKAAIKG